MKFAIILLGFLSTAFAFQTSSFLKNAIRTSKPLKMAEPGPTYWEGAAPPSSILGVGAKIPSSVFGPLSIVAFVVGTYCIHQSNIFNQITVDTIKPLYVLGSTLVPISWGMHVAAWIQKENKN